MAGGGPTTPRRNPTRILSRTVADTLALMKFRDTALTMKQWTGDLPTALRLAADEAPGKYFKYMADNIPGVADRSPKAI
jgi:hypothetical protein